MFERSEFTIIWITLDPLFQIQHVNDWSMPQNYFIVIFQLDNVVWDNLSQINGTPFIQGKDTKCRLHSNLRVVETWFHTMVEEDKPNFRL